MLLDIEWVKIVIINYYMFKFCEWIDILLGGRVLLKGKIGYDLNILEIEG